jgi:formylglycine-generating enzyme required for sulfatase activity
MVQLKGAKTCVLFAVYAKKRIAEANQVDFFDCRLRPTLMFGQLRSWLRFATPPDSASAKSRRHHNDVDDRFVVQTSSEEKLKIFISYSRQDSSHFVEELSAGLELVGFAPFFDRHDISAGEDWEARLTGLIQEADTVVFVISPLAISSDRCLWEVETALTKTKRLLPVISKAVADAEIPEPLRRRQFVSFDSSLGFTRPLTELSKALRQDIDWIREHTRLGELVARWEARGRPESLLLRGDDLAAAQSWAEKRRPSAPGLTDLMRIFINHSNQMETLYLAKSKATERRMHRIQGLVWALLIAVIAVLVGWINQSFLKEQWRWYAVTQPYVKAQVKPYVLTSKAEAALQSGESFKECLTDCPDMIVVPAGSFTMGSPDNEIGRTKEEGPQHVVAIGRPFAVSKYEVTFADWKACVAFGNCDPPTIEGAVADGQRPVVNVTWDDAKQYAAWLSQVTGKHYRLLSEAEYEYAARAGTQTSYPWGDEIGRNNANCEGCGSNWDGKQSAPVGSFPPNKFKLHDMVGNVWQWVEDCWHDSYNGAPVDGSPWIEDDDCKFRVERSDGWRRGSPTAELPRSALRDKDAPGNRNDIVGFRVARTLE